MFHNFLISRRTNISTQICLVIKPRTPLLPPSPLTSYLLLIVQILSYVQKKASSSLKLTVCGNTTDGFANACFRKQTKQEYISLLNDLKSLGYTVSYDTIEVGSLGHCTHLTQRALRSFAPVTFQDPNTSNLSLIHI